jgi:hypothetical protein
VAGSEQPASAGVVHFWPAKRCGGLELIWHGFRDPVGCRRARFICKGVAGLLSDHKKGRPASVAAGALIDRRVEPTFTEPPGQATHWTGQRMTAAAGVSLPDQRDAIVHHLQGYSVQRLSCPTSAFTKLRDVVGLYIDLRSTA